MKKEYSENAADNTAEKTYLPDVIKKQNAKELIIYCILLVITMFFIGLAFSYLLSYDQETWLEFQLPKIFWLSTLMLLVTSISMQRSQKQYKNDQADGLKRALTVCIFTSILFLVGQIKGWMALHAAGIQLSDTPSAGYLYMTSGFHAFHIVVGIILIAGMWKKMVAQTQNSVDSLLFFTNPDHAFKFRMTSYYWHTVTGIWVFLFLFFLYHHS